MALKKLQAVTARLLSASLFSLLLAGASAATETVLYNFPGGASGSNPYAGLIADSSGNLYGTTGEGGNSVQCNLGSGCGTVFELTAPSAGGDTWTETVLYSFQGGTSSDGSGPQSGLVFDTKGALYGTTSSGGKFGLGVVFKLTPPATQGAAWTETVLYSFKGGTDGSNPASALIFNAAGVLFGTTPAGGANNFGIAFKLTAPAKGTTWVEAILYTFKGLSDGGKSYAPLIFKGNNLYGTTLDGGSSAQGAIFELVAPAKGGVWTETALYSFTGGADGGKPYAGLILDKTGNFYSTTGLGGSSGYGTVFELKAPVKGSTTWTESVLFSFTGGPTGSYPRSGLVFDATGNLYSTTGVDSSNSGIIFELAKPVKVGKPWTESVLWSFSGGSDGGDSTAGLLVSGTTLYGTTSLGGSTGKGTVFNVIE